MKQIKFIGIKQTNEKSLKTAAHAQSSQSAELPADFGGACVEWCGTLVPNELFVCVCVSVVTNDGL